MTYSNLAIVFLCILGVGCFTAPLNAEKRTDQAKVKSTECHLNFGLADWQPLQYVDEIEAWQADAKFNQSIIYSDNSEQNFEKLIADEIDGFVEDPYVMAYKFRRQHEKKVMTTLPISISAHQSCFMFSKKRTKLDFIERFNKALVKVKQKPEFQISWFNL